MAVVTFEEPASDEVQFDEYKDVKPSKTIKSDLFDELISKAFLQYSPFEVVDDTVCFQNHLPSFIHGWQNKLTLIASNRFLDCEALSVLLDCDIVEMGNYLPYVVVVV